MSWPLRNPHITDPDNGRVIPGICCFLIQKLHRFSIELLVLTFESKVPYSRLILVPAREIVLEEQCQTVSIIE